MKIIINKNTPKDTLIYLKDILEGISKQTKNATKEQKKKIIASLLIISSLVSGTTFALNKTENVNAGENESIEVEIPMDIPTTTEALAPYIVERTNEDIEVSRNNIKDPTSVDEAIELYSDIFEVKSSVTGKIVRELIEKNPDDFYSDYILNNTKYDNMHEAIFHTILDIVYHPKKYNLNGDSIRTYQKFETDLTAEELTYIFSNYFDINPFVAQSIEYTECGTRMNSYDWEFNNNPAGIGPHNKFRNKATGVIYLCYLLKNTYHITNESGIDDLNNMASKYCTSGTNTWIRLTNEFYNELTEKGLLNRRKKDDTNFIMNNITYEEYLNQINNTKAL